MKYQPITQEERLHQMLNEPVQTLIPRLAIPTIISMLVSAIYNMADTFFVSQISTSASAAVGVLFSYMAFVQATGFMIGQGAGVIISNSMGRGDELTAQRAVSTAFFTAFVTGCLYMLVGFVFMKPMIYFLGATSTIYPYAVDYSTFIFIASPFMITSFVMNNLLRSQGNTFFAMIGIGLGGVINIGLDPLLIFGLGMGIRGAAVATMISQMISFCILLYQSNKQVGCIRIEPKHFYPHLSMYKKIIHYGFPSMCRQGLGSISTIILNTHAAVFGDAAIAAMSIVTRIMMFIYSSMLGFGQGFQPVCGYNFGAKKYDRVVDSFYFCVKVAIVTLTTLGVIAFIFSEPIITVFRKSDPEVIRIGITALRLQVLTLPMQAWIVMCNMITQQIGYGFRASIVSMGRQGLYLIPALIILSGRMGLLGIQLSQPVADVFTFLTATAIVIPIIHDLQKKAKMQK